MKHEPLVSVIIASYNHEHFVGKAIESVLNQTYSNIELLIGDDASPDNSVKIIAKYAKQDKRITFVPFKENRRVHIRNYFIQRAKGKYIAILNSDDEFEKTKIAEQVAVLEAHNDIGIVFTKTSYVDEQNNLMDEDTFDHTNRTRTEWLRIILETGRSFILSSSIFRRDLAVKVGGYNELLGLAPALDMWVKMLGLGSNLYVINKPLTKMRLLSGAKNLSSNSVANQNRGLFEISKIIENYCNEDILSEITTIFPTLPETAKHASLTVKEYLFCKYCIEQLWQPHQLFGIQRMYALLQDPHKKKELESFFGRTLFGEFLAFSGKIRITNLQQPTTVLTIQGQEQHIVIAQPENVTATWQLPAGTKLPDIEWTPQLSFGATRIKKLILYASDKKTVLVELVGATLSRALKCNKHSRAVVRDGDVIVICYNSKAKLEFIEIPWDTKDTTYLELQFVIEQEIPRTTIRDLTRSLLHK